MESNRSLDIFLQSMRVDSKAKTDGLEEDSAHFDDDNIRSKSLHPEENHLFDPLEAEVSKKHTQPKNYYQSNDDSNRLVSLEKNETENQSTAGTSLTTIEVQCNSTLECSAKATTQNITVSQSITQSVALPEHLKGIDKAKSNAIQGFINGRLKVLEKDIPSVKYLNTDKQSELKRNDRKIPPLKLSEEDRTKIIDYFRREEVIYEYQLEIQYLKPNSSRKQDAISKLAKELALESINTYDKLTKVVKQKSLRTHLSGEELNVFLYFAKQQFTPTLDYEALLQRSVAAWWDKVWQCSMCSIEGDVLEKAHQMLGKIGKRGPRSKNKKRSKNVSKPNKKVHSQTAQQSTLVEELAENLSLKEQQEFLDSL